MYGKKRRYRRLATLVIGAVLLLLLATGCRYTAAPADLLLQPSLSPERQAIVQAIEKALPVYSKLTLPLREDNPEAIRLVDVNADGVNEAIVSYYNEYNTPEIMVFTNAASVWKPWVLVEQPLARQIDWLKLDDLDKDGQLELLIGWIGGFDSPNVLEIFSFGAKPERNDSGKLALVPIESLLYTYAETGDLNEDGRPELAVLSEKGAKRELALLSATEDNEEWAVPEFELTLYNYSDKGLKQLHAEKLFNGVNGYYRMLLGNVSIRHKGIIVEGSAGAHGSYTALYAWEQGKLRLVYPDASQGQEGISGRTNMSGDWNGDGILELMWSREAPGFPDVPYSESRWINDWMQWNGRDGFDKIGEEYSDYRYGLQLRIPELWTGRYTLYEAADDPFAITVIGYWNEQTDETAELARLYAVPLKKWEDVEAEWKLQAREYSRLMTDSGNVFAVSFVQDIPEGLSAEDKQAFGEMLAAKADLADYVTIRNDFN